MGKAKKNFTKALTGFFLGANLCTILMLWICVASTAISPEHFPRFSLIGLVFPFFLLVNIAFCFFWLIFKARLIWVPLLGMAFICSYIYDYCPINRNNKRTDDNAITVISLNTGKMKGDEMNKDMLDFLKEKNPDIVCLQEIIVYWSERGEPKEWIEQQGYHVIQNPSLCILSRFPFVSDTINIDYPTRTNKSMAIWIDVNGDSVLVINNHLESNHLNNAELDNYKDIIKKPERNKMETNGRALANKLGEAAAYRGAQTDSICSLLQRHAQHSIILCGDLNDTPISYTYQHLTKHLKSTFRESGNGAGFSYKDNGIFVRIDHVMVSKDWQSLNTYIDNSLKVSDHYPTITHLTKSGK